ncbi:MAG: hypothetical protein JXR40_10695 [Pontiellaceae bacterium]|nr:hypothetical protein [Pontiellaceae bacterium]
MKRTILGITALSALCASATVSAATNSFIWNDQVGWISAETTEAHGLQVNTEPDGSGWITGSLRSEQLGWIELSSSQTGPFMNSTVNNWGVNISTEGALSGCAWNESVGWIEFSSENGSPSVSTTNGSFSGYAWNEQLGWISLESPSPAYQLVTDAYPTTTDPDPQPPRGTPQEWLDLFGIDEYYDAGDGVYAWEKYVMDVDPTLPGNALQIVGLEVTEFGNEIYAFPASPFRDYTLQRSDTLEEGSWSNVFGQVNVPGPFPDPIFPIPPPMVFLDTSGTNASFYRVIVEVPELPEVPDFPEFPEFPEF